MKKIKISLLVLFVSSLHAGTVVAQEEATPEAAGPVFAPIEAFVCNYRKGQTRADLDKVIAKWNKWMDDTNQEPYSAWLYSAYYNSPAYAFDVAWLGVWPDGNTMGRSTDAWLADGGEHAAGFDKVLDCPVHSNFAATQIRSGGAENGDSAVLGFSDCKVKEGGTMGDTMQAVNAWNEYRAGQGSKASTWMFFPVYGGEAEFDFKMVSAHPDYAALGADYESYGNGGGYLKAREIIGDTFDCGTTRIYNSVRVRDGLPKQ
ncbi:MAG: hypothetical protein HKN85_02115 [Gammaproteobacteria bacterium]|nr:hypothetical protein [Gammaproteobacteria bacterium]